jgi:hypothetical protein
MHYLSTNKQQTDAATPSDQPVFTALSKALEFYNSRNLKKDDDLWGLFV